MGKTRCPISCSHARFSPQAKSTYASAHLRGQWSSSRSKPAVPSQSCQASSWLSLMRSRRCSGELTKNKPPKLQNAWPPSDCSPSWSSSSTLRPASASSAAATSPARPAPTTMTSASMAESLSCRTSLVVSARVSGSVRTVSGMRAPRVLPIAAALALITVLAAPAYAKPAPKPTAVATYDVSYPQCGQALPAGATGGIVGVNNGIVFSANPCLATEWSWAQRATTFAPAFYANTGNPGPAYSSHWPSGQQTPQLCDGSNSVACSYDYGWNAALDSYADATVVAASPASFAWWLDVETGNSWETLESAYGQTATAGANDAAALAGASDALKARGVTSVGVYSTSYQWGQITGGTGTQFASSPAWVAGVGSQATAQNNCRTASFTGGPIQL